MLKEKRTTKPVNDPGALTHGELLKEYRRLASGTEALRGLYDHARRQGFERFDKKAKAEREALTDNMTGLYTKKAFKMRLLEEIAESWRTHQPIALVYIDGDKFKNVNDTHGHPIGDKTIQKVAEVIRSSMRMSDTAYRLGGEEFAVILPNTDIEGAMIFAENLRASVGGTPFVFGDGKGAVNVDETQPGKKFTISLGVTSYPEDMGVYAKPAHKKEQMSAYHAEIAAELEKGADAALYDAKTVRNAVRARRFGAGKG